jgi:hypothetical protein
MIPPISFRAWISAGAEQSHHIYSNLNPNHISGSRSEQWRTQDFKNYMTRIKEGRMDDPDLASSLLRKSETVTLFRLEAWFTRYVILSFHYPREPHRKNPPV